MLWQKESKDKNALLVNIFDSKGYDEYWLERVYASTQRFLRGYQKNHSSQKDVNVANKLRSHGNDFFSKGNYRDAMEQYNKCLCYAEEGSDQISFAYSNRSACFFNMKMYDKCLVDIELARRAGYPQKLMKKLDKRSEDCEKLIERRLSTPASKPQLSFAAHDKFPVFANSIRIDNDKDLGRRVTAINNLRVGQTIYLEPFYIGEMHTEKYQTCIICMNTDENLIPCKNCTGAMFCYNKCDHDDLHRIECEIRPFQVITELPNVTEQNSLIRSILIAIRIFGNIDDLMDFVEKTISEKTSNISNLSDRQLMYRTFLKSESEPLVYDVIPWIYSEYLTISNHTAFVDKFRARKYKRFLMHLIMQHYLILRRTSTIGIAGNSTLKRDAIFVITMSYTALFQFVFNHSCTNNIVLTVDNGAICGIVSRPIKKGEELCVSRCTDLPVSYQKRQELLWSAYEIRCNCELCELRSEKLPENSILSLDSDYKFIHNDATQRLFTCAARYTKDESMMLKMRCESFLQKFGGCQWCKEVEFVVTQYERVLRDGSYGTYSLMNVEKAVDHFKNIKEFVLHP